MLRTANSLAIAGTVFLAIGMTAAVFLISDILFHTWWAALTAALMAAGFAWFVPELANPEVGAAVAVTARRARAFAGPARVAPARRPRARGARASPP